MIPLLLIAVLLIPAADAAAAAGKSHVELIAREGTTWTAATWAYNTPKMLYDGERVYTVNLVGEGPGNDVARLYWRDGQGWHRGADLSPLYQPATLLLDDEGHINVFCTDVGQRGYHWRSARPRDVTAFEPVPLVDPERFAFGYLGVGRRGDVMALVGLDRSYAMWIAVRPAPDAPWSPPALLAAADRTDAGMRAPLYPVVLPDGGRVHVVYSHCPDGGVHNTYHRVEHAVFDIERHQVARHEIIAEGPIGELTYGLDALQAPDGTIHALYLAGLYKYGEKRPDIEERQGLYCATLPPGGEWSAHRISPVAATGQLRLDGAGRLHAFQSSAFGTRHFVSRDGGRTWSPPDGELAWEGSGGFLYVLKPNSGSVVEPGRLRAVQSRIAPEPPPGGNSPYSIEYVEMELTDDPDESGKGKAESGERKAEGGPALTLHVVPIPIESYRLLAMSMDEEGRIWAGSTHRVIHRYHPHAGTVETIALPYDSNASDCICAGNKVYVLGQDYPRLIIYDRGSGEFREADYPSERPDVWYGVAVGDRRLYLFDRGSEGLIKWDTETDTGVAIPYPYDTPLPSGGHYEPRDGGLWCRLWDYTDGQYLPFGLARFDVATDRFTGWWPFPADDADLQPYADPDDCFFLPSTLRGRIVPFDFVRKRWGRFLDVPRFGELFGFIGGPTRYRGRSYFPLSTYDGDRLGCDGQPYHFVNGILEFDPASRQFQVLRLETGDDAYYQIAYMLSARGEFYATGSNIREGDGSLRMERQGEVVFWQSHAPTGTANGE